MSVDPVNEALERLKVAAPELTFGGAMGYASGMAFRRIGRVFGVVVGLGFMGVQAASSSGYIDVDWDKIRADAIDPLDVVSFSVGCWSS